MKDGIDSLLPWTTYFQLSNNALSYLIWFSLAAFVFYLFSGYLWRTLQQAILKKSVHQTNEARLKTILDAIPDIVIRQRRDGTYLDINIPPGFGPTVLSEQSVNRKPADFFSPKLADIFSKQLETVLATARLQTIEVEVKVDSITRIYEARGIPFTSDEILLFVRDITERKQTEAENIRLRAEAETRAHQLSVLHELDRSVTVSQNMEDVYEAYVRQAKRLLNFDSTSVVLTAEIEALEIVYLRLTGADINDNSLPDQRRIPRTSSPLEIAMRENKLFVRDDTQDYPLFATMQQILGQDTRAVMIIPMRVKGQTLGTWNFGSTQPGSFNQVSLETTQAMADQLAVTIENARLYDKLEQTAQENARLYQQAQQEIAERVRAERALEEERASLAQRVEAHTAQLRATNDELARVLRAKDSFLASMSHELRTPLNAILGISEVLLEQAFGPLNERQIKYISTISTSGQGLSTLITDILDLTKVETGDLVLQIDPVALEALCQSSLRIVQQKAQKKELAVSLNVQPDCPPMVNVDERRMKQILVNLLNNAVKFTPTKGKIGLDVEYRATTQETLFSVWDTGIGIPEKYLGQLFQPFVQIDGSLDKEYEGIGLGLSLVNRLTQLHQGQIKLESQVGRGSRFTVSIPNLETSPDEDTQPSLPILGPGSSVNPDLAPSGDLPPLTGPLLLLAEDNEDNIDTMTSYLAARGFRLIVARNGMEAIKRARESQPNAILMDIHMPGLDGLEAIKQIRNCDGLDQIPIVALTGFSMPGDRERCLDMGATDYVSKPVSLKKLVNVIEKHLSNNNYSDL